MTSHLGHFSLRDTLAQDLAQRLPPSSLGLTHGTTASTSSVVSACVRVRGHLGRQREVLTKGQDHRPWNDSRARAAARRRAAAARGGGGGRRRRRRAAAAARGSGCVECGVRDAFLIRLQHII
jgi:hypothetical protein